MSHRRETKDQLKTARSEPVICHRCGSTEILYGKKRGLCKKCRTSVRKPKGGWYDAHGDKITVTVFECGKCKNEKGEKKMFSRKRMGNVALPDVCPGCGGRDIEVVEQW